MSAPPLIEATPANEESLWRRLLREGRAAYRIEARGEGRRRTRLQSAKILDASGAFLCEVTIQDVSQTGLRLLLARNCGLPARFGVHFDLTNEVVTAACVWRRERVAGVRVLAHAPPTPLRAVDRVALSGRYYALRA